MDTSEVADGEMLSLGVSVRSAWSLVGASASELEAGF